MRMISNGLPHRGGGTQRSFHRNTRSPQLVEARRESMRKPAQRGLHLAAVLALASSCALMAQSASGSAEPSPPDALLQGFRAPPDSAKPRTWWHWTNGNVTEEGITKDLEWMKRVGIGGFQLADVAAGGGQTVDKKINFGTPEWYHAVHHAADEASRLGLEMSIFSSPGW